MLKRWQENNEPKKLGFGLIVLFIIQICVATTTAQAPVVVSSSLITLQQNTLQASQMPLRPTEYDKLVDCLYHHESDVCRANNDQICIGKAGERNCMQFLFSTWKNYCVDTFGFSMEDIDNCNSQKLCADYMIQRDFGNAQHWTTYKFCQ